MRSMIPLILLTAACSETGLNLREDLDQPPNPPTIGSEIVEDRIVQVTTPSVDVLFIIDNSCSMNSHQTALNTYVRSFMDYFLGSGLDYHIGMVTTGWHDPTERGLLMESHGHKWIDPDTPDPLDVFEGLALQGTSGHHIETGRAQVYGAIELMGEANAGFYRPDASFAVIAVSDEDDQSGNVPINRQDFIDWMFDLKPDPEMVSFSGIVGPDHGCATADPCPEYLAQIRTIGGVEWNICEGNWPAALEEFGMQAAGLKREFTLTQVPVEDSIEVWVEHEGRRTDFYADSDWEYNRVRNSILFLEYIPPSFSDVRISYTSLAGAQLAEDESSWER
ncbi:MAG: hypothetical protein EA397_05935 [Deltaproteobacteria bacterium]|nr:MAG: hypothetical protein EA397_05935 [Deltaproteobacteria bacterium]